MKILDPDKTLTFKTDEGKQFNRARLAVVEWRDSSGHSSRWERIDEIIDVNGKAGECLSCGWILKDDKESIVIIPHIAEIVGISGGIDGSSGITIPKESVTKLTYLAPARKGRK